MCGCASGGVIGVERTDPGSNNPEGWGPAELTCCGSNSWETTAGSGYVVASDMGSMRYESNVTDDVFAPPPNINRRRYTIYI